MVFLQIASVLHRQRLLSILSEYDEYPAQYRQIIWKTLLKLPNNVQAYCTLVEKGAHHCTKSYSHKFRMFDSRDRKHLGQIVSYLCNWSGIIATTFDGDIDHFLPYFVFPFVKFDSSNALTCFELIATILINQCSLWFEFSPLLPFNYLGFVENLINYFEPSLITFYHRNSITNVTFAWALIRNAFSEVLVDFQWYQLWDHIISGPSYFLVFVVVAFNCVQRHAIKRLTTAKQIRAFFEEPTAINMKHWLRIAYKQMATCPIDMHPKQYMQDFTGLDDDDDQQYKIIQNYPRKQLRKRCEQKEQIQHQMQLINQKYLELEQFEANLMQQMVNSVQIAEHNQRMQNVELAMEFEHMHHINQFEKQQQLLIVSQRQLNNRETFIKMMINDNQLQNNANKHDIHLQQNLCELNKRVNIKIELLLLFN